MQTLDEPNLPAELVTVHDRESFNMNFLKTVEVCVLAVCPTNL